MEDNRFDQSNDRPFNRDRKDGQNRRFDDRGGNRDRDNNHRGGGGDRGFNRGGNRGGFGGGNRGGGFNRGGRPQHDGPSLGQRVEDLEKLTAEMKNTISDLRFTISRLKEANGINTITETTNVLLEAENLKAIDEVIAPE